MTHLQDLVYPGDARLEEFMEDWYRIENDLEDPLTDRQRERILYSKIKNSKALKPYLDKYSMLDDDDEEHTYDYLLNSVERHLKKTRRNKNLEGLTNTLPSRNLKVNNWTPKT